MRKTIIYLLIIAGMTYSSCQDEASSLGNSLMESSFRNVITDTCTVQMSTLYVDSVETLGDSICQIGHYKDSIWGEVTSSYFAEYSLASFTPEADHTYHFDSITISFTQSGNFWGDTLTQQRISVYPLKYEISLPDNEKMYSHSKVALASDPLFNFSFTPEPGRKKKKEFRMPDDFGETLLNDIVAEKEAFDSQEKFKSYLHGFAFIPEKSDQCISGLQVNDSSMYITLYYKDIYTSRMDKVLTFNVNTSYAFTSIDHDRSGTPLAQIESGIINAVPSSKLNQRAYLQGLTGFYNEIEFPHLNNLMEQGDIISIESATLYLYPVEGSYGKTNQLPSELRLYIADENNVLEDQVYSSSGTTVQNGNLTLDDVQNRNSYYSFDITSFLQSNLGTTGMYHKKLLLNLADADFTSTFKQVIFANDKDKDRQVKLDIRYKAYTKK